MSKFVKDLQMKDYEARFGGAEDVLFVNVVGINATDTNKLRLQLRKKGIELQVVKNSLARKVLEASGKGGIGPALEGASAIVWGGEDVVQLAREIADWAKKIEKLSIKGGCVAGSAIDAKGVQTLSQLPSRPELLGRLVAQIVGPAGRLVSILQSAGGGLASQIKTISEPKEESAEAAAP